MFYSSIIQFWLYDPTAKIKLIKHMKNVDLKTLIEIGK